MARVEVCEHKSLMLREGIYKCINCWETIGTAEAKELWAAIITDEGVVYTLELAPTEQEAFTKLREALKRFVFYVDDDEDGEVLGDVYCPRYGDLELLEAVNDNSSMDGWNVEVRKIR